MSKQRAAGLVLLATSLLILYLGYSWDNSAGRASPGDYAVLTVWYWAIGAISAAFGTVMLQLGDRADRRHGRKAIAELTRPAAVGALPQDRRFPDRALFGVAASFCFDASGRLLARTPLGAKRRGG